MQKKGITFSICDVSSAKRYLRDNTYYFKLKSYERVYDRYSTSSKAGQYVNLDFAYLQELAILDMYFRKMILDMTIDIEHALKTSLVYDLSLNDDEDGYGIVQKYFDMDYSRESRIWAKIGRSAVSDLVKSHKEHGKSFALWELVEILSLGDFIDLYQLYYVEYPNRKEEFSSFLWSIKFLRNAAAHNNCLLNSMRSPYSGLQKNRKIAFELSKIKGLSSASREKWLSNPVVHDFIVLVYVYLKAIKSPGIKDKGIKKLQWFFNERSLAHSDYFTKNNCITHCYDFTCKIILHFCNKYRVKR